MNRIWLTGIVGSALILVLMARPGEAPPPARPEPTRLPRVHIQQDFVRIPVTEARPPARKSATVRPLRAQPALASRAADAGPSVWTKAARLLVGDGRHRPEPFPRPGRQ